MNLSLFTHSIEKLCTICHVILRDADTSHSLFSTFDELESPMNVLQVLQSFSNFNFCKGAQMVCTMCYRKTIEVYKFIQVCNKAHDNMQHYWKNIEAIKTITDVERDVKIEEISISPTRNIIDGREFLEEMETTRSSAASPTRPKRYCLKMMNLSANPFFTHGIEKLCILCHVILRDTDTSHSLFSTFEELESPVNVLQVLHSFSDFNFCNGAQTVCTMCYEKTIELYKFIQICNKAHDNMQHYLKNIEAIKDVETNLKMEEISIEPIRIIINRREFLEEMENEKISNEEKKVSSDFDNLRVEKIDAQIHDERMCLIKCKDCHLVFSDKKELSAHRKEAKHTKEKPFLSEMCNSFLGTKYNFRTRNQRYNAKRAHISEDLRLNQDRPQPLKDHEIDVECPECQEVFKNDQQLKIHMRRSHKNQFLCNHCGKVFTTIQYLNTHIHVHTGEKSFTCLICQRVFAAPTPLRNHMIIHNGVKPHKCEQCDRRFTRAEHLRSHMNIHNGEKPHKCEQCDRRFTQASALRSHMKIHNGAKPHRCEQCYRSFPHPSNLRRHMDSHNEVKVKAHKCEQCDRRFTRAEHLRTHMDIHNGVKAHKCEQCDRRFTQAQHLRGHMESHKEVKAHKCDQCDRQFTQSWTLRRHIENIHT